MAATSSSLSGGAATVTENGAPAISAEGVAAPLLALGRRGGAMVVLAGSLVGPRGCRGSHSVTDGTTLQQLRELLGACLCEGEAAGGSEPQNQLADLAVFAFHTLDVIHGRGERALFVDIFLELFTTVPALRPALLRLVELVPSYGCWRTLGTLYAEAQEYLAAASGAAARWYTALGGVAVEAAALKTLSDTIVTLWAKQLAADDAKSAAAEAAGDAVTGLSLAGKWAPSIAGAVNRRTGLGTAIMMRLAEVAPALMAKAPSAVGGGGASGGGAAAASAAAAGGASSGAAAAAGAAAASTGAAAATAPAVVKPKAIVPGGPTPARLNALEMQYRRLLSRLRAALDVVERKMCARQWSSIVPEHVPSLANAKYKAALLNTVGFIVLHDRTKGRATRGGVPLPDVKSRPMWCGKRKANEVFVPCPRDAKRKRLDDADREECAANFTAAAAATVAGTGNGLKGRRAQVHELVGMYLKAMDSYVQYANSGSEDEEGDIDLRSGAGAAPSADPIVEAMWADILRGMQEAGTFKPGVPMVDISGSMDGLPMQCSIAFGALMGWLQPPSSPFHKKALIFSSNPFWADFSDATTLWDTVSILKAAPWQGTSTQFSAASALILEQARAAAAQGEAVPSTLFVFSDMQFNQAARVPYHDYGHHAGGAFGSSSSSSSSSSSIYNLNDGSDIRAAWRDAGLEQPRIVFWNLRATRLAFQADAATPGVALVSGFSQECLKAFMEGGDFGSVLPAGDDLDEDPGVFMPGAGAAAASSMAAAAGRVRPSATAWQALSAILQGERYDRVRGVLTETLAGYTIMPPARPSTAAGGGAAGAASGGHGATSSA